MKEIGAIALLFLLVGGCSESRQPTTERQVEQTRTSRVDRENTAVNARDRDAAAKTPFDQKENQADIDMTAKIRKQVVATKMSTDAHNVKIITQNVRVTLRGPVKSVEEKQQIEKIAQSVAGADKVDSQLEVQP